MTDKYIDHHSPPTLEDEKALPELKLDLNKYRDDLSEYKYTPEQENQMLQAIWDVMTMMVHLGWGIDSVHMLLPELFEKAGADSDKLLEQNISETFISVVTSNQNNKETDNG